MSKNNRARDHVHLRQIAVTTVRLQMVSLLEKELLHQGNGPLWFPCLVYLLVAT
jgi:hypothetical protein